MEIVDLINVVSKFSMKDLSSDHLTQISVGFNHSIPTIVFINRLPQLRSVLRAVLIASDHDGLFVFDEGMPQQLISFVLVITNVVSCPVTMLNHLLSLLWRTNKTPLCIIKLL